MSKQIIPEVAILRPLALFLVMLGHCLAPFAGFWDKIPSEGGQNISLYWWLGQFIVKFHVELFIFISGYIFAYQSIDLARVSKFKEEIDLMNLDFDYDGIVIKIDNVHLQDIIGTKDTRAIEWGVARKWNEENEVETVLTDVEWQVGRTGVLTPVGRLVPVECNGVVISNVTLHNMDFIKSMGINIGDILRIDTRTCEYMERV